jgi:CHASE3 domain sensor protein
MRAIHKRFGIIVGFVILLILLAINTVVLRHQLAIQVGNQEWFSRSRRVVQELRNTESLLKDTETGQRGYLYTGKPEYLAPYTLAVAQIDSHVENLAQQNRPGQPIFEAWYIKSSRSWHKRSLSISRGTQREPRRS